MNIDFIGLLNTKICILAIYLDIKSVQKMVIFYTLILINILNVINKTNLIRVKHSLHMYYV